MRQWDSDRSYLTLDDLDLLRLALRHPDALVRGPHPVTLDEVQRQPNLLSAVKQKIDKERRPGHFLLTGSGQCGLWEELAHADDHD